jgi:hypothetical protein
MTYFLSVLEAAFIILSLSFILFALSGFQQWPNFDQMTLAIALSALLTSLELKRLK